MKNPEWLEHGEPEGEAPVALVQEEVMRATTRVVLMLKRDRMQETSWSWCSWAVLTCVAKRVEVKLQLLVSCGR